MNTPLSQPLIAVRDVLASTEWYAKLLKLEPLGYSAEDTHGGVYNRLLSGNKLILQLHSWDDEEHPNLTNADKAPVGHGVLLWFEVDDFDAAVGRAQVLDAEILEHPFVNKNANHRECWLHDPDGYVVVLASHYGDSG